MKTRVAVDAKSGIEFIGVTADEAWISQHGTRDEADTAALAALHAERGMETYTRAGGRGKVASIRLTTSIPDGSLSLINPNLGLTEGNTCWICICDDATPPNCVCTPC